MKKIFHFVSSHLTLFLQIFATIVPVILFIFVLLLVMNFLERVPIGIWTLIFVLFLAWFGIVYAELLELHYLKYPFTLLGKSSSIPNFKKEEPAKSYVCSISTLPEGENSRNFRMMMSVFAEQSGLYSKIWVMKDGLLIKIAPWKKVFLSYSAIVNVRKNEYWQKEFIIEHRNKELRGDLLIRSNALYEEIMERWNKKNKEKGTP